MKALRELIKKKDSEFQKQNDISKSLKDKEEWSMKEIDGIEEDSDKYEEDSDDDEYERNTDDTKNQTLLIGRGHFEKSLLSEKAYRGGQFPQERMGISHRKQVVFGKRHKSTHQKYADLGGPHFLIKIT